MKTRLLSILILFMTTGCSPASGTAGPPPTAGASAPAATARSTPEPTRTPAPAELVPSPTPTNPPSTLTPDPTAAVSICAPLAGLTRAGLEAAVTNPYHPPPFGSDDPHQGIDLAEFLPGTRIGISGAVVLAVLPGTVALVVADRFPYGNAVMLETPEEILSAAGLTLPPPEEEIPVLSTLTCPGETRIETDPERRSLYLLYAHLQDPPTIPVGEMAACGSPLGRTGDTGNALNPHVHLEARAGPSGAVFPGMSHYNPAASTAEMDAYCIWRVGGLFRPVDPGLILELTEW